MFHNTDVQNASNVPIAQLDRALVYGTKGREFESLWAHQAKEKSLLGALFFRDDIEPRGSMILLAQ